MSRAWVSDFHSAKMHFGVWILQPTPYITEKSVNFGAIWANIYTLNKHLLQMIIGTGKAWKSNYIHYKVWDELFIRYKLQRLHRWSLGMGKQFHLNTLLGMRLIIHTGIRINPCYVFFCSWWGASWKFHNMGFGYFYNYGDIRTKIVPFKAIPSWGCKC